MNIEWITRAKKLMAEQGRLTQGDLVEAFSVKSSGAVSHYFTKRNEPTIKQLTSLAKFLKVTPQYLLFGDNSINSSLFTHYSTTVRNLNIQHEICLSEEEQVQLVIYIYNGSGSETQSDKEILDLIIFSKK